jgi:hypothetical protein
MDWEGGGVDCAIARILPRSVLLPANPGRPNPAGGSPVGTTKQEPSYKVSHASVQLWSVCATVLARASVLFCVNSHMLNPGNYFEFSF